MLQPYYTWAFPTPTMLVSLTNINGGWKLKWWGPQQTGPGQCFHLLVLEGHRDVTQGFAGPSPLFLPSLKASFDGLFGQTRLNYQSVPFLIGLPAKVFALTSTCKTWNWGVESGNKKRLNFAQDCWDSSEERCPWTAAYRCSSVGIRMEAPAWKIHYLTLLWGEIQGWNSGPFVKGNLTVFQYNFPQPTLPGEILILKSFVFWDRFGVTQKFGPRFLLCQERPPLRQLSPLTSKTLWPPRRLQALWWPGQCPYYHHFSISEHC